MSNNQVEVCQVDVFTQEINQGNPAGVVLDAEHLSEVQMQYIAKKAGYNETVFILPSSKADVRLRYFTPGYETPLCGHATLGAVHYLHECGKIPSKLTIETSAGVLDIRLNFQGEIFMEQAQPRFIPFEGSKEALCQGLNIHRTDLSETLPIEYGNTGSWTLVLPVSSEDVLARMIPQTHRFPEILTEIPKSSIHPFVILSEKEKRFYGRHFSSPFSGTVEDSVTGTASGVMGAYLQRHLYQKEDTLAISVFQGKHMQREGQVNVFVERKNCQQKVRISGQAIVNPIVKTFLLE